jgi:SDR family mycofactocin-dependent oxidoreductase
MTPSLQGKVAFVTGAGRGVGRSYAVRLAESGADLVLLDVGEDVNGVNYELSAADELDKTAQLAREHGAHVVIGRGDVRDSEFIAATLADAYAQFGRLDIVCANAGIASMAPIADITDEMWESVIGVNLTGAFKTVRAAIPYMRQARNGGAIVFTSSTAAVMGSVNLAHYCASKHGLTGLMRVLAHELADDNIRVNAVLPTSVNTPMIHNAATYADFSAGAGSNVVTKEYVAETMQSRNLLPVPWVEPEDVANAMLWLVSDSARMVTGVMLPVDAGKSVP